jgi:DNA-binding winged helix-turn-helix (wHTH) protein
MRAIFIDCISDAAANSCVSDSIFKECVFIDNFNNNFEEAEYCVDIRFYDVICIQFKPNLLKSYLNIIGTLNRDYELHYQINMYFAKDDYKSIIEFKGIMSCYKNVEVMFIESDTLNLESEIKELINTTFMSIPVIKDLSISDDKSILTVITNDGNIELPVSRMIDIQVLLYFLRHYGEVININTIISSVSLEPELTSNSPIETAISSIRKNFKTVIGCNPIKAFKRVGYQFKIA